MSTTTIGGRPREFGAMWALAWPVILSEMAWILMGIVDTIVVGPLGPAALGAVGTGSTLFFAVMAPGMGVMFALDTFVARSFGAGRVDECHRWLFAGLQLAAALSVVLVGVGLVGVALLPKAGIRPEILVILQPYLRRLLWSAPPLLFYTVVRRYLQAMNAVREIMAAVVLANIINAAANWIFVYGRLGAPAMGAAGSAYATIAARLALAAMLWAVLLRRERARPSGLHDARVTLDVARMRKLLRLGAPVAGQIALEVGVFATAAALAGAISAAALAANQIALNIAGFFFMIPYGLSSAAAVRVGQAVGRGDAAGVRRAGWTALGLSLAVAVCVGTALLTMPFVFLRIFTTDASVLAAGARILLLCALFQPFDGAQAVATGALRGLGDTRTPMWINFLGHWLVGLPLACALCFHWGWGVVGLWSGLSLGLVLIGASLVGVWYVRSTYSSTSF